MKGEKYFCNFGYENLKKNIKNKEKRVKEIHQKEFKNNEIIQWKDNDEKIHNDVYICNITIIGYINKVYFIYIKKTIFSQIHVLLTKFTDNNSYSC